MAYDIVYILKEDIDSEELRYSLRSVCKNFDFNKIWFYCGCPEWAKPDYHVPFKQKGYNKLDKVHNTMRAICENEEITSSFYLFNDDFFILKPYNQETQFCNGTLLHLADLIEKRNSNKGSFYSHYLCYSQEVLNKNGYDTLSYACHVPILINKEKALETLNSFPGNTLFRSMYGNHHSIGGILIEDVKIVDYTSIPGDWNFVSTNEDSFARGAVGEFIRQTFPIHCHYELTWEDFVTEKIEEVIEEKVDVNEEVFDSNLIIEKPVSFWKRIKQKYFTFPYQE